MKKLLYSISVFFFFFSVNAQEIIKIDGSISYKEVSDTIKFKDLISTEHVLIRESKHNYYIAIHSNVFTMANIFIYDEKEEMVKNLHASASLGNVDYQKQGDFWQPIQAKFDWEFVDPQVREVFLKTNITDELFAFYKKNHWVASTVFLGAYRETEFLIAKKLFPDTSKILIVFTAKKDGKSQYSFWPNSATKLTQSKEMDQQVHFGYVPKNVKFNIESFGLLK